MNNPNLNLSQEIPNPVQLYSVDYIAAIPHETDNFETCPDFENNWWCLKRSYKGPNGNTFYYSCGSHKNNNCTAQLKIKK